VCSASVAMALSAAACDNSPSYSPSGSGGAAQQIAALPAELVGRWNGGSNENGHWYYEFDAGGTYRAWPAYTDNAQVLTGTAVASGGTLTLSNSGAPVSFRWNISGGILYLDGFSYLRA
jgi:hypothetical protein